MEPIAYAYKPLSLTESNILINNLPSTSIFCIASANDKFKTIGLTEPMRHSRPHFIQLCKYGDLDMIFTQHPLRNEWINAFESFNLTSKIPIIFDRELRSQSDKKGNDFSGYIPLENLGLLSSSVIGKEDATSRSSTPYDEFTRSWNSEETDVIRSDHNNNSKSSSIANCEESKTPHFEESNDSDYESDKAAQNDIIPPFIGDLLCKSLDNLCFLGMFATKMQCPKEVPTRIQNLHEVRLKKVAFW